MWTFEPTRFHCRASPLSSKARLGVVPCPNRSLFLMRGRGGKLAICEFGENPCEIVVASDENVMTAACAQNRIAAADGKGRVFVWDEVDGKRTRRELAPAHGALPLTLEFAPGGEVLASGDSKGGLLVWRGQASTGETLKSHTDGVSVLAFSPDGSRLLSAGFDATACEWDLLSKPPKFLRQLKGHEQSAIAPLGITSAVYDRKDRFIATSGVDATVRLWEPWMPNHDAGQTILTGHEQGTFGHGVSSLDSADAWLASGGEDGVARLWALEGDMPGFASVGLVGHTKPVDALHFILGNSRLMTVSQDQTVRVWPVALDLAVRRACEIAGRDLSPDERSRYLGKNAAKGACAP